MSPVTSTRDLLAALVAEHQPSCATQTHLVEELRGAIWRKRRVLQAEGASINHGLKAAVRDAVRVIPAAAPFDAGMSGQGTGIRNLVGMSPEEVATHQRDAKADLEAIKAQALGEGLQAYRLEKLNRYETHLDRKFERTLAMRLKLKELRRST